MCGIAGIVTSKNLDIKSINSKVLQSLGHRGPDGEGSYLSESGPGMQVFLAHTRLSIIDLTDSGQQPMSNETDSIHLVCNGEIYNYKSLRKQLCSTGHHFKSNSDSEVILHLYEDKGPGLLEFLRGMFAFVIWESRTRKLFLARDRFGIKPLYYYWDGSTFIFSSEIRTFMCFGVVNKDINENAFLKYLKSGSIAYPETIYKNIHCLEPGHYLTLENQNLNKSRYWSLAKCFVKEKFNAKSKEQLAGELRAQLQDSVKLHTVSDVPVGVFLSGGVDSSSIVSLLRDNSCSEIKTISAVFPYTSYDESVFARNVAEKYGTEHIELEIPESDVLSHIKNFLISMDQPTVDGLNSYLVSWAAKQAGLKVCLSGLGGDELFGGYSSFFRVPRGYRFMKYTNFLHAQRLILGPLKNTNFGRIYDMLAPLSIENVYLNYRGLFSNAQIAKLLDKKEISLGDNPGGIEDISEIDSLREKVSCLELSSYMSNQLLRDSDIFGMCHSLEIRVPFVDHKLVEFVAKIPKRYKYQRNPNKHFLIKAVADLPEQIYNRPKKGFTLPFDTWLRNELKDAVQSAFDKPYFFNGIFMKKLLDDFYKGKIHWSRIWTLFIINNWFETIRN